MHIRCPNRTAKWARTFKNMSIIPTPVFLYWQIPLNIRLVTLNHYLHTFSIPCKLFISHNIPQKSLPAVTRFSRHCKCMENASTESSISSNFILPRSVLMELQAKTGKLISKYAKCKRYLHLAVVFLFFYYMFGSNDNIHGPVAGN